MAAPFLLLTADWAVTNGERKKKRENNRKMLEVKRKTRKSEREL